MVPDFWRISTSVILTIKKFLQLLILPLNYPFCCQNYQIGPKMRKFRRKLRKFRGGNGHLRWSPITPFYWTAHFCLKMTNFQSKIIRVSAKLRIFTQNHSFYPHFCVKIVHFSTQTPISTHFWPYFFHWYQKYSFFRKKVPTFHGISHFDPKSFWPQTCHFWIKLTILAVKFK